MENGILRTQRNSSQTMRPLLSGAVLAVVVLVGTATIITVSATPMLNHHQRQRRGRALSGNNKVRGKFQRQLMDGKGGGKGGKGMMGGTGDGTSGDGYTTDYDNTNGDGSHTNIFDHTNTKVTEVACGSATSPFLSTFVTSIEFTGSTVPGGDGGDGGGGSGGSKKSSSSKSKKMSSAKKSTSGSLKSGALKSGTSSGKGKGKGGKDGTMGSGSGSGNKYPADSGDGFGTDIISPGDDEYATQGELPVNELSPDEQRLMERIFSDVYNGFTFEYCDGFFRTVYTVSMTMAERNDLDPDGIYSVSLSRTYTGDNDDLATPDDGVYSSSSTGYTPTYAPVTRRERHHRQLNQTQGRQRYWADPNNYDEGADTAVPVTLTSVGVDGSLTRTQTVVGSELVTIYYVSLTATCRNCAVTPEVNFPLLMIPESEESQAEDTNETYTGTSYFTDEVCTCPVYSVEEEAYSRYRKNRRELQQEGVYHPPPRGPTSEELIDAINSVIARNDDLGRIVGLVQLIEPDYFNSENPDRIDAGTTAPNATGPPVLTPATLFPTATPLTRPPTSAPTISGDREIVIEDSGAMSRPNTFVMVISSVLLSALLLWWN